MSHPCHNCALSQHDAGRRVCHIPYYPPQLTPHTPPRLSKAVGIANSHILHVKTSKPREGWQLVQGDRAGKEEWRDTNRGLFSLLLYFAWLLAPSALGTYLRPGATCVVTPSRSSPGGASRRPSVPNEAGKGGFVCGPCFSPRIFLSPRGLGFFFF